MFFVYTLDSRYIIDTPKKKTKEICDDCGNFVDCCYYSCGNFDNDKVNWIVNGGHYCESCQREFSDNNKLIATCKTKKEVEKTFMVMRL